MWGRKTGGRIVDGNKDPRSKVKRMVWVRGMSMSSVYLVNEDTRQRWMVRIRVATYAALYKKRLFVAAI